MFLTRVKNCKVPLLKAFDYVVPDNLWHNLIKLGIRGVKLLTQCDAIAPKELNEQHDKNVGQNLS